MQSRAPTVDAYLASLPEDRRAALSAVRAVIRKNLDPDYEEGMQYGGIGYYVPHRVFPPGYHCDPKQPLPFAGLASQKQYMAVYLIGVYTGKQGKLGGGTEEARWFREAWLATGRKLDMGKCCVRFKRLEDVALDVVGESVRRIPAKVFVQRYVEEMAAAGKGPKAAKPAKRVGPRARTGGKAPAPGKSRGNGRTRARG